MGAAVMSISTSRSAPVYLLTDHQEIRTITVILGEYSREGSVTTTLIYHRVHVVMQLPVRMRRAVFRVL